MEDEFVMCEEYAKTLEQLVSLLRLVCYSDKYTQSDIKDLQSLGGRSLLVDVYVDVFLPNLDIIAPLTMGQVNELSVCDNIDIKLLKSYISVVDNCELALQVINPKGVELEIMS